jgi:hypothetical protein
MILREDHASKLLAMSEMPHPRLGIEARGIPCQIFAIDQIQYLRKNKASGIHSGT